MNPTHPQCEERKLRAAGFVSVAATLAACGSVEAQEPVAGDEGAALAAGGPAIGDPCTADDGWQPDPLVIEGDTAPSDQPTAIEPPEGYVDYSDLPPGVRYCIPSGGAYPLGYMTASCETNADCPDQALCMDPHLNGQCRRPCSSDGECLSPTTCIPTFRLEDRTISVCLCPSCVAPMGP